MSTRFCRHIRLNGERCCSPALNSKVFCYYHAEVGKRHRTTHLLPSSTVETLLPPINHQDGLDSVAIDHPAPLQLDFPPLEDRHSIQLALSMLITAMAQDRLDSRRAATMLYGLQIASSNARDLFPPVPENRRTGKVRNTVVDTASGNIIAPDEDPEDPEKGLDYSPKGTLARYIEQLNQQEEERYRMLQSKYPDVPIKCPDRSTP